MRHALLALAIVLFPCFALAEAPDISRLPPHPRLYIGGLKTAAGHIDPQKLGDLAKDRPEAFKLLSESSDIACRALACMTVPDKAKFGKVVSDLANFRNRSGDAAVSAALAFDWIASELSPEKRKAIATHLYEVIPSIRPDVKDRFNCWDNNPLQRRMGVGLLALAIADDEPRAIEEFKYAHALFEDFIRVTGDGVKPDDMYGRGCYGGGWPEGVDYDRHGSRYAMLYFLGLRSATGMDVFTGSQFWKDKQYYIIYNVLPNAYNILGFQDVDYPMMLRHDREVMITLSREFKNPHTQWYLNQVNKERDPSAGVFEFLFYDPKLPQHDYSDLPLARYIPGVGTVLARSGWGPNDTFVAFVASDWYVYHQNNAQNVFAIFRNAPLAVKDGVYDGSVHDHYVNYSIRTVAYNGITVMDPDETDHGPDGFPVVANDGGQLIQQWHGNPDGLDMWRQQARRETFPMRDIVDWLAFETNEKYTYAAAEAGRSYMPGKVPFFSRQILFVYPNWVVVFDRVKSGKAQFQKKFHLHAPEDLSVSGNQAVATTKTWYDSPGKVNPHTTIPGRLFIQSLLPAGAKLDRIVGEATYEGKAHPGEPPYNGQFLCPSHLEISAPNEESTCFLTAMYACDATIETAPEAKVVEETPDKVVVELEGKWKAEFARTGDVQFKMLK